MEIGVWDLAAAGAKACTYAATLGAAGIIFFVGVQPATLPDAVLRPIRRVFLAALSLALLASAVRMLATLAAMSGDLRGALDPASAGMYVHTGEGPANAARLVGLLGMASALKPAAAHSLEAGPFAWAGAIAAATSFAWVGHTHAAGTLLPAVVALHLLCAAFWWGALPVLLSIAAAGDPETTGSAAARFGKTALWVVGALLAAGALLLCFLLDEFAALWHSNYGRMVLVKLALVAVLLAAAGYNKLALTPRLLRGERSAVRALRQSIWAEMTLLLGIFVVTAAFTTLAGPRGE